MLGADLSARSCSQVSVDNGRRKGFFEVIDTVGPRFQCDRRHRALLEQTLAHLDAELAAIDIDALIDTTTIGERIIARLDEEITAMSGTQQLILERREFAAQPQTLEELGATVGESTFEEEWARGRAMSLLEAIDQAVGAREPHRDPTIDDVHEDRLFQVGRRAPGAMTWQAAMTSPDHASQATMLPAARSWMYSLPVNARTWRSATTWRSRSMPLPPSSSSKSLIAGTPAGRCCRSSRRTRTVPAHLWRVPSKSSTTRRQRQ